jgi:hypothetical protein
MPAEAVDIPSGVVNVLKEAGRCSKRFEWAGSGWQWSEVVVKTAAEIRDAHDREENGGHDEGVNGGDDNEGDEEGDKSHGDV